MTTALAFSAFGLWDILRAKINPTKFYRPATQSIHEYLKLNPKPPPLVKGPFNAVTATLFIDSYDLRESVEMVNFLRDASIT